MLSGQCIYPEIGNKSFLQNVFNIRVLDKCAHDNGES